MRKPLVIFCLLVSFSGLFTLSGCGGASDSPPPKVDEATRKKKAEEAAAAQEKGMQEAPKGQRPGG